MISIWLDALKIFKYFSLILYFNNCYTYDFNTILDLGFYHAKFIDKYLYLELASCFATIKIERFGF